MRAGRWKGGIGWKDLNGWKLVVLFAVLTVTAVLQLRMIDQGMPINHSDLLIRVVGTRDALKGMNPYSERVIRDIQTAYYGQPLTPVELKHGVDPQHFDYPALIVPLMAPFVGFSWTAIWIGYTCLMIPGFLLSSYWWVRIVRPSVRGLTMVALIGLSLLVWPTVWGLRLQQPTMLIAILVAAGCFAVVRRLDLIAGVCMALALVKPQVSFPLVLWLLVWSMRHRRWRFPASFAATLIILWAVAGHMVPGWFPEWIGSLGSYTSFTAPICVMLAGKWIGWTCTVVLGLWSIWVLWGMLEWKSDTEGFGRALALSLAATVFILPTMMPVIYDQIFLFPGVVVLLFVQARGQVVSRVRKLTLMLVVWDFACVVITVLGSLVLPEWKGWIAIPFWGQALPIVVLVALLVGASVEGWSSTGPKKLWRRGQERVEVDRSEASVGMLRRVPYTIRAD